MVKCHPSSSACQPTAMVLQQQHSAINMEHQSNHQYRKTAAILLVAGFIILFFVVTPLPDNAPLKTAGMAAAFLLFTASIYFNFKARPEVLQTLQLQQSIAILVAFVALAAGISFFS